MAGCRRDAMAAWYMASRLSFNETAVSQARRTQHMARVPYLQQSDLPPEHRDILARPIALNRAMANSPNAAKAMTGLAMYIRHHSKLDQRLRELAILQVGYLTKSPYEYSHHVKLGREAGVTDDDIRAINEETAGRPTKLDALSKAVLRAAREMTTDLAMSDTTFAELEKALGREQVIDLTLAIAFYNAVVRLLGTLQIDVEPEYQRYLEEHPLPR
jgi:alkylhydroperoxidase family enzyme